MSCIILAGGKSSRLGKDKVSETVGKKGLLQRVISCVSPLSNDIIVVTVGKQTFPELVDCNRLRIINDIYPGKGPLGGIYTGLVSSTSFYNLIVASDMPFLNQALLRYMVQLSVNFDLVVPRVGNLTEPLHAVYTKDCLAPIERMVKQGELEIYSLFNLVKVRYVEAEEIERYDPGHLSFFNINTAADLKKARELDREKIDREKK